MEKGKLIAAMDIVVKATEVKIIPNLNPGEDIDPVMFILDDNGIISTMVRFDMPNNADKGIVEVAMRNLLKEQNADGYVIQFMGWQISVPVGEVAKTRPSKDPNRVEALMMIGGSKTDSLVRVYIAERTDNTITALNEIKHSGEDQHYGLFVDMLNEGSKTIH